MVDAEQPTYLVLAHSSSSRQHAHAVDEVVLVHRHLQEREQLVDRRDVLEHRLHLRDLPQLLQTDLADQRVRHAEVAQVRVGIVDLVDQSDQDRLQHYFVRILTTTRQKDLACEIHMRRFSIHDTNWCGSMPTR
jgi:hypothetical protein